MKQNRLLGAQEIKALLQRYKYALLIVLAGVLLLGLGGGIGTEPKTTQSAQEPESFDLEAMERKLERALSEVSGAGRVTVVLSLREGSRRILAQDTRATDTEQSRTAVIIAQGSGTERPVEVQSILPLYQGALVVCDGADSAGVRLELTGAVRALTGLSAEKISICKRK